MRRNFVQTLLCSALLCAPFYAAHADVKLPSGDLIPKGTALQTYLNGSAQNQNINEGIDGVRDAQVEPQKFSPLCDFSGRYVAKGGGANFAIGWYNVDDARASNNPPKYIPVDLGANLNIAKANSDIQILFPFSASLPPPDKLDLSAASIRSNPAYKNGLIGFVLVPNPNGTGTGNATQYHYTEHRFNTYCSKCTTPGPWYSTLIYKSNKLANTFYLGFEDLDFLDAAGSTGVNGNDLDYEDFLFRFTGVTCVGAGQPCTESTQQGACQLGVTECDGQGKLFCKAIVKPGQNNELCDGIDNDCNGTVDDKAPCPVGQACSKGRCAPACGTEFPCNQGMQCVVGECIENACVGKTCAANQVCRGGNCVSPCDGIKCPSPYMCSGGLCVDPCAGVTCGQGKVCSGGACITTCDCLPCGSGQTCQSSSQKCVDTGCENTTCGTGQVCQKGACADPCQGAVCPTGQVCAAGKCGDPPPDNGGGGGEEQPPIDGGTVATGCSCRFAPAQDVGSAWGLGVGLAVLLGLGRNVRRRKTAQIEKR